MKTLTKKTTHIAKIRQLNATQIERVCELLGWTHEQYCNHQYAEYEKFISRACHDLPMAVNYLRYSPMFRGFYNNEWITRNETNFLPFANTATEDVFALTNDGVKFYPAVKYGDPFLLDEYLFAHSAQQLFHDESFAVKYGHIIDQILPYV